MKNLYYSLSILMYLIKRGLSANILYLALLGAPSHHIWNEALINGLLKNGHNITLLGHDKPKIKSPNYNVLYIEDPYREYVADPFALASQSSVQQIMLDWEYLLYMCELDLKSEALRQLMEYPANQFEMIIFDVGAGQCMYPLLDLFSNAVKIGVSPFATPPSIAHIMGHNVPSYIPIYGSQYGGNMNIWERTHTILLQAWDLCSKYYYFNIMHRKSEKVFGKKIRDFYEVEQDFTVLLTNNNPILDYPHPFPSNIISVGGLHVKPGRKLNEGQLQSMFMFGIYTMKNLYCLFPISMYLIKRCLSANILYLALLGAPSHHIWNEALVGGLLKNGHNITLVGHDKPNIKSPNYHVLYIEDPYRQYVSDPFALASQNSAQQIAIDWDYQQYMCELDLKSEALRQLMEYPANHFELIIFDVGAGSCTYPLLDLFSNVRIIGVSPFATPPYIAHIMGHNVPSYIPIYGSQYGGNMNIWERTHNILLQAWDLCLKYYYFNIRRRKSEKVFGKKIRNFFEVEQNFTLLLTNNNLILDYSQPFPPNIISVGGLHVKPGRKVDEELQTLLDNAKHGVIYFSMGSIVASASMSKDMKEMFLNVFRELKQIVLWKFEIDGLDVPKNVVVRKWFPQNDILAHKNVVLFISHCGGLSTQEAIYHGVPMLGIPIFVDQHNNAAKMAYKGGGLLLNYNELSYERALKDITEILENPKYKKEMSRLSRLFRDQQTPPLDTAVFWVEYMLRNKDIYANDLSPYSRYMKWYQIYSLHLVVIIMLFSGILLTFFGMVYAFCLIKTKKKERKMKTT